jgi:hypothetical protein
MTEKAPIHPPHQVIESWKKLEEREENEFVTINYGVLDEIAKENPDLEVPNWRFKGQHAENDWPFATQTVVSSVLNWMFLDENTPGGSWAMENPENPGQMIASSNALHTRVYQKFGEAEDITSRDLFPLSRPDEFDEFLPGIPMREDRQELLFHFAAGLTFNYGGSVRNLLESSIDENGNMRAFNDGKGLVDRLLDNDFKRAFKDTGTIGNLKFPFLKRAQLAALLYHGRAEDSDELPKMADIDMVGPVVDYHAPNSVRHEKGTEYSPFLAAYVDNWKKIKRNSRAENELRAATFVSIDYVQTKTNEIRTSLGQKAINSAHSDFMWWSKGRTLKKLDEAPLPHLTETTAY